MKKILIIIVSLACSSVFAFRDLNIAPHLKGTCTPNKKFCAYFAPTDMPVEAVRAYLKTATKSIRIATYNMSIFDYADVLNEKAESGVKIEYMLDFKHTFEDTEKTKPWSRLKTHPNITKYRLPNLRGYLPQMHNKIIIIDNEVLLTGSANYSYMGLVANYENVMAIYHKDVIKKFNDEVNELKQISISFCKYFSNDKHCYSDNPNDYNQTMFKYAKDAQLSPVLIDQKVGDCHKLFSEDYKIKQQLFNETLSEGVKDIHKCFKSASLRKKVKFFVHDISQIEKYIDGSLTSDNPDFRRKKDNQTGDFKVYFSPEDNIAYPLTNTLKKALKDPKESFAYISTNFITNGHIANTIMKLHDAGVRIRILFDFGRFKEKHFQSKLKTLLPLGFFGNQEIINNVLKSKNLVNPNPPDSFFNLVTVFKNEITSDYGCNHNKMAIIGTKEGLTLINGSANWSGSAVKYNDENLMIIKDQEVASIYLKEILAQMYVYRYGQDQSLKEFKNEIFFLSKYSPCLKTLLGKEKFCYVNGKKWQPEIRSSIVVAMKNIPAQKLDPVYLYVKQLDENTNSKYHSMRMYTHKYFNNRWVTTIPSPLDWNMEFHAYIDGVVPSSKNYYSERSAPISVNVIKRTYFW